VSGNTTTEPSPPGGTVGVVATGVVNVTDRAGEALVTMSSTRRMRRTSNVYVVSGRRPPNQANPVVGYAIGSHWVDCWMMRTWVSVGSIVCVGFVHPNSV
jgi:hypothetical protein